jgi:hypothetical protein
MSANCVSRPIQGHGSTKNSLPVCVFIQSAFAVFVLLISANVSLAQTQSNPHFRTVTLSGEQRHIAGCNSKNNGDACSNVGSWDAPKGWVICGVDGEVSQDNGQCDLLNQATKPGTMGATGIKVICTATSKGTIFGAPFAGGGHADYFLNRVWLADEVQVCLDELPPVR